MLNSKKAQQVVAREMEFEAAAEETWDSLEFEVDELPTPWNGEWQKPPTPKLMKASSMSTERLSHRKVCLEYGLLDCGLPAKDLAPGMVNGKLFEAYQEAMIAAAENKEGKGDLLARLDEVRWRDDEYRTLFILVARNQIRQLLLSFLQPAEVAWLLATLSERSNVLRLNLGHIREKFAWLGIDAAELTQAEREELNGWKQLTPIDNIHS